MAQGKIVYSFKTITFTIFEMLSVLENLCVCKKKEEIMQEKQRAAMAVAFGGKVTTQFIVSLTQYFYPCDGKMKNRAKNLCSMNLTNRSQSSSTHIASLFHIFFSLLLSLSFFSRRHSCSYEHKRIVAHGWRNFTLKIIFHKKSRYA